MRVSGGAVLHATPARAWQALTDPAVLKDAIAGCETLELLPPSAARLTVTTAVASTGGLYSGRVEVTERVPPESLAIKAALAGEPGTITATARLRLAGTSNGNGATQVTYEANADVAGDLAAVGQSLLTAAAARLAARFFEAVDEQLAAQPERTERAAVPAEAAAPRIPEASVSVAAPSHAKASASAQRTPHWRQRLAAGRRDMGAEAPPADGWRIGRGFAPGVVVGTTIGIAAAKLGNLIARRNR